MDKYYLSGVIGGWGYVACRDFGNPVIAGNVSDAFLAGSMYFYLRWTLSNSSSLVLSLGLASLAEAGQALGVIPGTYDVNDFLAYGAGTLMAYVLDRVFLSKNKSVSNE